MTIVSTSSFIIPYFNLISVAEIRTPKFVFEVTENEFFDNVSESQVVDSDLRFVTMRTAIS